MLLSDFKNIESFDAITLEKIYYLDGKNSSEMQ